MAHKLHKLHIHGRRWFQRTYGNTYHTVRIYVNDECITLPMRYGYGDQYLQTALDALASRGYIDADERGRSAHYGTQYIRETLGGTYDVTDVSRQRDLSFGE